MSKKGGTKDEGRDRRNNGWTKVVRDWSQLLHKEGRVDFVLGTSFISPSSKKGVRSYSETVSRKTTFHS